VPADIIDKHPPVPGAADPYGLVVLFNIACAGHVEVVDIDPAAGPQSVPIGCFDENHVKLGPSEYVIGFTRIYAYANRTNANPVIQDVLSNGASIKAGDLDDPTTGLHLAPCTDQCASVSLDVVVPQSSQETNPGDTDPNGTQAKEEIWVDYFATDGNLGAEARLLYDTRHGHIPGTDIGYTPPTTPKDGFLFIVVHDNRDGVDWRQIPLHVH
jgi:hypothetical protein